MGDSLSHLDDLLTQTVKLQIGFFFSAELPLCTYFTVLENVTI